MLRYGFQWIWVCVLGLAIAEGQDAYEDEAFEGSEAVWREASDERFVEAHGLLLEGNKRQAFRELKRLAARGHAPSQHLFGVCHENGFGIWKSPKRAAMWYQTAAEAGYPLACLAYAESCLLGRGVRQDYERAAEYLEPLAETRWQFPVPLSDFALERGIRSRAAYLLGLLTVEGSGVEKDTGRAVELLIRASQTGDAMASMYLSMAYAEGEIVQRDLAESKRYFELADLQSFDTVRRSLEAAMLANADEAVRKDFEEAAKELSETYTQALFASQARYARAIMTEGSEDYDPEFGRALLEMAAAGGHVEAQYWLGRSLCLGIGGDPDYAAAISWLTKASQQGWILADFALGVMRLRGMGCEVNETEGRRLLDDAAESGFYSAQLILDGEREPALVSDEEDLKLCQERESTDARAAYAMGRRRQLGWLMEREDPSKRQMKAYREGAEAGYARSQHAYAEYFYWGMLGEKNYQVARDYFQKACDQGHAQSYFKIGYIYEKALGVEADFQKAKRCYEMSCDFGDDWAANNLGAIYTDGDLGEKEYEKAMRYYLLAAERGNAVACYNIGDAYRLGRGRDKNIDTAVEWYGKAVERGDLEAAQKLIKLYRSGEVSFEDSELAYWTEKAAEMGDRSAMWALSEFYLDGVGVPKSPVKAAYWLSQHMERMAFFESRSEGLYRYSKILLTKEWAGHDPKEAMKLLRNLTKDDNLSIELNASLTLAKIHLDEAYPSARAKKGVALLKKVYKEASKQSGYAKEAAEAAYRLSRCFAKGIGVAESQEKRVEWMKVSAEIGLMRAKYFVAVYQINGVGQEPNVEAGVAKLDKLSEGGMQQATLKLGELIRDGLLARKVEGDLAERLKELSAEGNERARKLCVTFGLDGPLRPEREAGEGEESEIDPFAPATVG